MAKADLSADRARELFDYDPATGILTRKPCLATRWLAYPITHSRDPRGYLKTSLNKKSYFVHRLVWLIVHGNWPAHEIDHINRNPGDNRVENLRDVPRVVNLANRVLRPKKPPVPLKGISKYGAVFINPDCRTKPYRARIRVEGKPVNLGYFRTPEEARAAIEATRQPRTGQLSTNP